MGRSSGIRAVPDWLDVSGAVTIEQSDSLTNPDAVFE